MPRCYLVKKNATKFSEESGSSEGKTSGPKSPTEATTAPNSPNYYKVLDRCITMANGYANEFIPYSQDNSVIRRTPVVASHDGGIPIFRERSAEETEAAHDLLELSRSLPPLPNPVVVRVSPKYDDFSEKKYSKSYQESPEASPIAYYEESENYKDGASDNTGPKPHIPVSVVVRVPSSVQGKNLRGSEKSMVQLMTYESPDYEEEVVEEEVEEEHEEQEAIPSVICDTRKSEISKRLSEEPLDDLQSKNFTREFPTYSEKVLPSLLPFVPHHPYRNETTPSVICDAQCSGQPSETPKNLQNDPPIIPYEDAPVMSYEQSLSSASPEKSYDVPYNEASTPNVIAMSPPRSEVTHVIPRPVPTKVISLPQDSSVPTHVVQFSHIVPNTSYDVDERSQSAIKPVYPVPSGSLLPPAAYSEPESGTNFVSHTPVIRYQPSSETLAAENSNRPEHPAKPLHWSGLAIGVEYHSDAENNNPNSNDKSAGTKKKRLRASFLPMDWKRKKTNPSEDTENSGKRKYSCTQCGKKYATSSNLSRHKQTHRSLDSQSAKKCMTCGKAYVSMPALAMHLLTHKLSHACGICGKMFSRPWLLQGHLRSHTGEKPYRCGHCGKAFADRSNLRAHMQTHSFEKNYICLKCKKSFALKSYLSKHLESSCLKENNDIEMKSGMESPTNSMDTIDVETWSKDGDVDDPLPIEIDSEESMDEIVVV